jgi:GntR family transcriptional regulator
MNQDLQSEQFIKGLNPQSPIPLYRQLADIISEKIRAGEYRPGARIPSEIVLAKTFGIGRPTARQATEALIRKGMLLRRRGAGTFVREQPREVDLFSLGGTLASFKKRGVTLSTDILHPVSLVSVGIKSDSIKSDSIKSDSRNSTNPYAGGEAYFFSRLSSSDGMPVLIEDIYLHPVLFRGIDRIDLTDRSLSRVVEEQFFMRPVGGKQLFRSVYPNRAQGKRLMVSKDTPILEVHRFLNFPQAENAVYSELFCRTDKFVFSQIIVGGNHENTGIL